MEVVAGEKGVPVWDDGVFKCTIPHEGRVRKVFLFCGPSKFWSVVPLARKFAGETSVGLSYHFVNLSFLFVFLGVIRHSGKLAFIV